jgi:hypothetical protein
VDHRSLFIPDGGFVTKDSGARVDYASGMRRDIDEDKPNYALISPLKIEPEDQILTRWAALMTRGAEKYGKRNWERAKTWKEHARFKSSAFRHFMQWFFDADDGEDHAVAVMFNITAAEYVKLRKEYAARKKAQEKARGQWR